MAPIPRIKSASTLSWWEIYPFWWTYGWWTYGCHCMFCCTVNGKELVTFESFISCTGLLDNVDTRMTKFAQVHSYGRPFKML